jgi:hypothetical protein
LFNIRVLKLLESFTYDPDKDSNDADNNDIDALLTSILESNDAEITSKLPENTKNDPDSRDIEEELFSILTSKLEELTKKEADKADIDEELFSTLVSKLAESTKYEPENDSKEAEVFKNEPDNKAIEELKEAVAAFNSSSVAKVAPNDDENISKSVTLVSKLEESA